jgi:hypothetical protein
MPALRNPPAEGDRHPATKSCLARPGLDPSNLVHRGVVHMLLLSYLPDIDFTRLLKQEKSARGDIRAKQL